MYRDNGTNFVGTKSEFEKAFKEMKRENIEQFAASNFIEWNFNPPSASHMGGSWERAIRSVRRVLFGLMQESSFCLDADTLHTLFCEVELIVNSRPLNVVSTDVDDVKKERERDKR
jgi:hypothetical protein